MIAIADTLRPECVRLALAATEGQGAIDEVAALLETTPAVLDWDELHAGLHRSAPCLAESESPFAICLPHARTDAVNKMVMAVGRALPGVSFGGDTPPVRYIFCIGVPKAMASDYLRIVGLLARVLKDPATEGRLAAAATPVEFIQILSALEAKL
jgi:mannitol/fructose-specific phosphotransferase system IIA component (Ntr-type)